ncbi:MAG: phosphotransferase [Planctomycetota bacterium]
MNEAALAERVLPAYGLDPPVVCRFLERGDSDIYRVEAGRGRVYFKVYRPPHSPERVEAEARFAAALISAGLPCVRPVSRSDGRYATVIEAPEGPRPAVVYEEAPPPLPADLNDTWMEQIGRLIGQLHNVADTLAPDDHPYTPEHDARFGSLVAAVEPYLNANQLAVYRSTCEAAACWQRGLSKKNPAYGPCHADLVLPNIRATPDGQPVLFDLGNAAMHWRALELAVVYWNMEYRCKGRRESFWRALLEGYRASGRETGQIEDRLPMMLVLRQLAFMAGCFATCPIRMGVGVIEGKSTQDAMARLERLAKHAGLVD